jgi:hypothetical protein
MLTVPEALHAFGPTALAVRAVQALAGALELPRPVPYPTVEAVVDALVAAPRRASVRERALAASLSARASRTLAIVSAVDLEDRALVRELGLDAYETEPQANDAVFKAIAIADLIRESFQADPEAAVSSTFSLPSGPLLAAVWAAMDVALPLGTCDLASLVKEREATQAGRLDAAVGGAAEPGRRAVLEALVPWLQREIDRAVGQVPKLIAALSDFVPGVEPATPGAARTIAVKMDRLPVYKWLGARIAAERAVLEASG